MGLPNMLGYSAAINMLITVLSIILCWRVLQNLRIENFMSSKEPNKARFLLLILSIILGHQLARFIIDYLDWSRMLGQLFM